MLPAHMMAGPIPLFIAIRFCSLLAAPQAVQPSTPLRQPSEPVREVPAPDKPTEPHIGVRQAIRAANEILNRLEAGDETDSKKTLLERVDGYIKIVQTQDPTNSRLTFLRGRVYALVGWQGDAIDRLLKFVDTPEGRNEWRAFSLLGDLFVAEFPQLAKANYKKAVALNPNEPSVLLGLSICASKLGKADKAIQLARQAVSTDGRHTIRYISHLATLLKTEKQWDEALREADDALTLALQEVRDKPATRPPLLAVDAQYRLLISILQARINEPEHSASGGPDDYMRLANHLRQRARIIEQLSLHDVLGVLQAGVDKTAPNTPPPLLQQYGITLVEVGRTDSAIDVFDKLLQIDPNDAIATEWLNRLRPESTHDEPIENP